jgi:hypothetical protein
MLQLLSSVRRSSSFHSLLHFWGKAFDLIDDDDSGFITKSVSVPFSISLHSIDRQ